MIKKIVLICLRKSIVTSTTCILSKGENTQMQTFPHNPMSCQYYSFLYKGFMLHAKILRLRNINTTKETFCQNTFPNYEVISDQFLKSYIMRFDIVMKVLISFNTKPLNFNKLLIVKT